MNDDGQVGLPANLSVVAPDASILAKFDGICWWCRAEAATTGEHKYKQSDLTELMGDDDNLVWGGDGGELRLIRGKSGIAREGPARTPGAGKSSARGTDSVSGTVSLFRGHEHDHIRRPADPPIARTTPVLDEGDHGQVDRPAVCASAYVRHPGSRPRHAIVTAHSVAVNRDRIRAANDGLRALGAP